MITHRELDALVAEKVMGLELMKFDQPPHHEPYPPTLVGFKRVPSYSEDIAAAWEVLSKFESWSMKFDPDERKYTVCLMYEGNRYYEQGAAAPDAICLAALRAVGVEEGL